MILLKTECELLNQKCQETTTPRCNENYVGYQIKGEGVGGMNKASFQWDEDGILW